MSKGRKPIERASKIAHMEIIRNPDVKAYIEEFIPIKPLIAMAADAGDSYATHSRFP
jgi:hypothetical protein